MGDDKTGLCIRRGPDQAVYFNQIRLKVIEAEKSR